ncbi:MAG: hypothetical protein JW807_08675 [Spirochaetes bacterium]|nr:hypothetical protein [Spirochaetota bacterium]
MTKNNRYSRNTILYAAIITIAAIAPLTRPALGQDNKKQKIPYEIIEDIEARKAEEAAIKHHRLALGLSIDPFSSILSAVDRQFGIGIQPWFGIDRVKIRLDISHLRVPNDIAGTRYFHKNNINTFGISVEYFFSDNFEGFLIGGGFGFWANTISHKHFNQHASWMMPCLSVEGGYVWKFHKNVFIEPCLALNIMLKPETVKIFWFRYRALPAAGEITLKFGIHFDI